MKRIFDIFIAGLMLVALSPVLLLIWATILVKMGPPALFRQTRPGLQGRPFNLIKFRTMRPFPDGLACGDAERMTRLGRFLRSWSLDELPELWNVLIGDMSLVGPRPLLTEYLPLYTREQARRHRVRPGLTGWAQVNGRNALGWDEKFALDVWYVDHVSFRLDLKILWLTIVRVLARDGISADGEATMSKFTGTEER
jgi:lipopolysaccharide/colanic/teichoic acid biosynthesis glycosyltransferase